MQVRRSGENLCVSDSRMRPILFAQAKAAYGRLCLNNVVWVRANEMNQRKGHNCLTVFADLITKWELFATSGKDASVWEAFP